MNPPTPTVMILDLVDKRITLDGREVAPATAISADYSIDTNDGVLGAVTLTLYADNIVVRTGTGQARPVAADAARRIVREGLADVLAWLGETDE